MLSEMMLSDKDLGWVAGMFEGEGCIYISTGTVSQRGWKGCRCSISSVDEDTVRRFHDLVKVGHVHSQKYKTQVSKTDRVKYVWMVSVLSDSKTFLSAILPLLGERRTKKALEALAIEANPNGYGPRSTNR